MSSNAGNRFVKNLVADTIRVGGVLLSTATTVLGTSSVAAARNVIIGESSGTLAITGTGNVGIGNDVLDDGSGIINDVIAIGTLALSGALTSLASSSIGIGGMALNALTSGDGNVAIGGAVLDYITTGSRNTGVGYIVLGQAAATTSDNTGVGYAALAGAVTALANGSTAVGSRALNALTSGAQNTAVGRSALAAQLTNDGNTAVGYNALSLATGATCTAVGADAMGAGIVTATGGVAVGYRALRACTSGLSTVIGSYAARSVTTGGGNTVVGYSAMELSAVDASQMTAVGEGAIGAGTITNAAAGAVAIGYGALSNLVSGAGNTAVGWSAANLLTTGANNTVVGYNADVDAVGRAGTVILGSGGLSTASNQFALALGGTNVFRSTMTTTSNGTGAAALPANTDYITVSIYNVTTAAFQSYQLPVYNRT